MPRNVSQNTNMNTLQLDVVSHAQMGLSLFSSVYKFYEWFGWYNYWLRHCTDPTIKLCQNKKLKTWFSVCSVLGDEWREPSAEVRSTSTDHTSPPLKRHKLLRGNLNYRNANLLRQITTAPRKHSDFQYNAPLHHPLFKCPHVLQWTHLFP